MFDSPLLTMSVGENWEPVENAAQPRTYLIQNTARLTVLAHRETVIQLDMSVEFAGSVDSLAIYQGEIELLSVAADKSHESPSACRVYFAAAIGYNPIDFLLLSAPKLGVNSGLPTDAQSAVIAFEGYRCLSS